MDSAVAIKLAALAGRTTTQHFNGLTEAEAERLALLIEECGEVIQAAAKILRHGYESNNNGALPRTNREDLQKELGDLLHALDRLEQSKDVSLNVISGHALEKSTRIAPYLHHQSGDNA